MSELLEHLRSKYDLKGNIHEPNPDCKFCKGVGERSVKNSLLGPLHFCICLFVDHEASDEIGTMLGEFASKQLKRMRDA